MAFTVGDKNVIKLLCVKTDSDRVVRHSFANLFVY